MGGESLMEAEPRDGRALCNIHDVFSRRVWAYEKIKKKKKMDEWMNEWKNERVPFIFGSTG